MTFADAFNRADDTNLGADWAEFPVDDAPPRPWSGGDVAVATNRFTLAEGSLANRLARGSRVSDSFNRADAGALGSTDGAYSSFGGYDDPRTWFENVGTWGIATNQARTTTTSTRQNATVIASATGILEVTIATVATGVGIIWRGDPFGSGDYWRLEQGASNAFVKKRISGVDTTVATISLLANGDRVRVHMSGNTHTVFVNDVQVATYSDSAASGNSECGLFADATSSGRWEDFRFTDIAPLEAGGFARAEHDVGSNVMYAQAEVGALAEDSGNQYPILYIGAALDGTFAGPLAYGAAYSGPPGIWLDVEQLFDTPFDAAAIVYAVNANGDTHNISSGDFGAYFVLPFLAPGDVVRLAVDTDTQRFGVLVNGTLINEGTYDLSSMSPAPTLGQRGGIGMFNFWSSAYAGTDALDNYEQGVATEADFTPPAPPPPPAAGTLLSTLYDTNYLHPRVLETVDNAISWEEQLSDAGSGSFKMQAYEPGGAALLRPAGGEFVTFSVADGLGGEVKMWSLRVEDDTKVRVGDDLGARKITVGGRGPLSLYERSEVYPTMGYGAFPTQIDMYYDWRHVSFDDSAFVTPTAITTMTQAQTPGVWGHSIFLPWSPNFPAGPAPFPDPDVLWASSGSLTDAPTGKCYFRQVINFPAEITYVMWLAADNRAIAYLDGVEIGSTNSGGGSPDTAGWFDTQQPIWFKCSAGNHVLAIEAENLPRSDSVSGNPAGVAWNIFIPGFPVTLAMCIAHSNTSDVVMSEYPATAPGMPTPMAVRLFVEKAQSHGDLLNVDTSSFDDTHWSDGAVVDTPYPCISTKVLTDGLSFLREVSGTYADIRADRDNPLRLLLYAKGTMNNVASGVGFRPDVDKSVVGMEIRRDYKLANVLIGVTKNGYVEVRDPVSVAVSGRWPQRVELGSYDNDDEAVRALTEMLVRYSTKRDEITATIDGPVGYLDYDIGNTVPTVDSADNPITDRIQAISARQDQETGRLLTTPTVKDLFFYGQSEPG